MSQKDLYKMYPEYIDGYEPPKVGLSRANELLVVKNGVTVEVFNADGTLNERHKGPSEQQLKAEHDARKCGAFCGYCYDEAMEYLDN